MTEKKMLSKRIIFTMGGKGGVGKTGFAVDLADWYRQRKVPFKGMDFDIENKEASGFQHFEKDAIKFDIHKRDALDNLIDIVDSPDVHVLLCDQAAASGRPTFDWFNKMAEEMAELGVKFTAVGLITGDPGSVVSVLQWADQLQDKVDYLIVKNQMTEPNEPFKFWNESKEAKAFTKELEPSIIELESRNDELEQLVRNEGITLRAVADGKVNGLLAQTKFKIKAKGYLRRTGDQLDEISKILLP